MTSNLSLIVMNKCHQDSVETDANFLVEASFIQSMVIIYHSGQSALITPYLGISIQKNVLFFVFVFFWVGRQHFSP